MGGTVESGMRVRLSLHLDLEAQTIVWLLWMIGLSH
jgi:hypothetical protein